MTSTLIGPLPYNADGATKQFPFFFNANSVDVYAGG